MAYEFKLPEVGEGIEEAEVLKWMVDVGDGVLEDDPLAEVETDKAIIEVPSPVDGRVRRLHADVGERVAVGEVLVTFERGEDGEKARNDGGVEILDSDGNAAVDVDADGGEDAPVEGDGGEKPSVSEATRRLAREVGVDPEEVEGSGEDGEVLAQDILHAAKEEQEERDAERGEEEGSDEDDGTGTSIPGKGGKTPTMEDDETTAEFGQTEAPAVEPDTAEETSMFGEETPVAQEGQGETEEGTETEETERAGGSVEAETDGEKPESGRQGTGTDRGERKTEPFNREEGEKEETPSEPARSQATEAVGGNRGESGTLMTHHDIADAERTVEVRDAMREDTGVRLTYSSLLVKACAEALNEHEVFNRRVVDGETVAAEDVNVGVATETNDGVAVPVVENADEKGVEEIAADLVEAVENPYSGEADDEPAFTLVNIGAVGGEGVSPVVDKPGVAAVSVGEVRKRPFVVDGEVVARHTVPLYLTFDGRFADSSDAARFINDLKRRLREPAVMLL